MAWTAEEIAEKKKKAAELAAQDEKEAERAERQPHEDDVEIGLGVDTFLTPDEIKLKFQKGGLWAAQQHKLGKLRVSKKSNNLRYSETDIINILTNEQDREATADAIRSATSLVKQSQDAMGLMFKMTFDAQKSLLETMQKSTETSHAQVLELETSIRDMRLISDKANTEEYARQVMKQESEQKMVMQQRAFASLQTVLLPYIQKKMGFAIPLGPSPSPPNPKAQEPSVSADQKTMLADGIISWFQTLPADAVAKMKEHLPPEHAQSFAQIADLLKGNEL